MPARFNIRAADPAAVSVLQQELGLPRFIAATLVARGVTTPEEARVFLAPSLERDWLDPYLIPGLSAAVDALEKAVRSGKHILVFGDFDLDGISSTAVMTRALRELGAAQVTPFIPLRFEEGYALTPAAMERALKHEPDVIVTVDCGISCKHEVAQLVADGIEVVVTDHHEPSDLVPEGVPVCDPKIGDCPSCILAGVGVSLKVVQALGARFGMPHLWRDYTDLATLGTVADLMPMLAGNRALVADGVARMNTAPRPCIAALLAQAGAADRPVAAHNLSFSVIPRLNAAGRMGDAQLALDLLLTDDFEQASAKAAQLEAVNDKRRAIEAELAELAREQAAQTYHGQRALVVAGEGWHEGVKGIVASRLVNAYGVPTLLFTIDGDEARGSGRSVGQVNLFRAVESCADLLTRFGGHEAAVGVTLPADKLPEFAQRLCDYMDGLSTECFHPRIDIDACVCLDELTLETVGQLEALAPFGQENPVPRYLARDVMLSNCRAVGADKNHFSCVLTDGRSSVSAIMFHCSDIASLMHCGQVVNAAFEVQIDEWRGRRSVKAMLSSLAPAEPCAALEACLNADSLGFVADLYATSDTELCADCPEDAEAAEAYEAALDQNRSAWERTACEDPGRLQEAIIRAFIGDGELHESQQRVLEALARGESTLAVMATGRGKSLTFQVHAACLALRDHQVSVFVYPLRALIADQAFHLSQALEPFGVRSAVLTGESTPEERRATLAGMTDGTVDIVLTTPEFLQCHAVELARCARIGFVVVDEAHHIGLSKAGNRPAYAQMGEAVRALGNPTVLALTATAGDEVARDITLSLGIENCVLDAAARPNLTVEDERNLKKRESYLANLVASGQKTVIYVNSREQSIALARSLRKQVPQMASLIGFYNAGLSRAERVRIEELFRTDALCVLVSTSAFGEGVNIPNIRNVVLYHLPFNEIEFNQMSGRAGRDGQPARIHLLFGREDAAVNARILDAATPDHDRMAQVYREIRRMQRATGEGFFTVSDEELAHAASQHPVQPELPAASAACGIAVFRELGLVETRTVTVGGVPTRSVRLLNAASKVELTDSVRYREGLDEREIFNAFRDWALKVPCETLQARLCRPILPAQGEGERS
ncbi:single-stranded-DNA-specific exonuclease RecJ [Slackia piriformis]|nr:single-stranded-DNA-specific exonuclease RecJ [Slackia piriformis]